MRVNASAPNPQLSDAGRIATSLEDAGVDGVYFPEISHDALLAAAVAGASTHRITVGTSIALAFTRGPMQLAYSCSDLAELTRGRFVLGLGPQIKAHIERRFGVPWSDPVPRMRELVVGLRRIWDCWDTGGDLRLEGHHYRLSLMPPAFRPEIGGRSVPPVYLAAVGPAMTRLAGEVGDGLFLHAFSTPQYAREVTIPALEEGLARSGRSRSAVSVCYSVFTASGRNAHEISAKREAARAQVAFYASTPAYRGVLEVHGLGDLQHRLQELTRQGRWEQLGDEVSDEVLDLFVIAGSPVEVCEKIGEAWSGLADQVMIPADFWIGDGPDPAWSRAVEALAAS
jgi:probable F420-dependent oxidoreductase